MEIEQRLSNLGLQLPSRAQLVASHSAVGAHVGLSCKLSGNQLYCTEVPQVDGRPAYIGRLGADLSVQQGYEAARVSAVNALASMKEVIGDLDRIRQIRSCWPGLCVLQSSQMCHLSAMGQPICSLNSMESAENTRERPLASRAWRVVTALSCI